MKKNNIKIITYECENCKKIVYFKSSEKYETKCKTCGSQMILLYSSKYKPNNGLKAIKQFNSRKNDELFSNNAVIDDCPYCHSTDTKKITNTSKVIHTALFGVFSMGRNSKNYHCNNCGSDF